MINYLSTATTEQIASRLGAAATVAVLTHSKPDGDAMGSVLGLVRALRARSVDAHGFLVGPIDPNLLALARQGEVVLHAPGTAPRETELVVVVDTGAWSQVEPLGAWLKERADRVIGIDHHARGDDLAPMRLVDVTAASATQVLLAVIDSLGVPLEYGADAERRFSIAEALFAGLAADTGWFRFSSADERVFHVAGRLLGAGVNKQRLVQQLEENERPTRLAATGLALQSIRWLASGSVVMMRLSYADIVAASARPEDLGGIVNVPLVVGSVSMSILLTEAEPGITKISFRSKPLNCGRPSFDVNKIAATFGGGGHVQAAGARILAGIDVASAQVEDAVHAAIGGSARAPASAG
ncbi:MAG: DHH family phosphoesterase [Planctomycetota bacterium]|nr:DHH family phosphoesterase [Planctomycetota bacterium]MDA1105536.1 DHH family phosphoesterase [Planctomycetota bacterium]